MKGSAEGPFKSPSKRLQDPFKSLQEGVEIDDALGFPGLKSQFRGPGGPVAGNESLEPSDFLDVCLVFSGAPVL